MRPVLSSVQFLRGPPTLTPPPSQRTAPLPSVRPTIKGTKLFLLSFLHLCRFPSMEIRVPVSPSPRGAKKAWKPSRRVPRYHIWCGRRLHISSAGVAAWKGCGYSMRISSSSTAHPCPFLGLTLAPAHDTSVSDMFLGAPQRRSLGRSTTSVQHAADCSRESSVLKLAGPYMYMYTPTVLHVPVPECVPCVSTRVNVNTTDATTGATALLLPAPCVSRVCPGSPGVFLNTRNYSVTTEHVV